MITPAEFRHWRTDAERDPLTVRLISVEETLALLDELERCERQIDDHYDAARDRLRERDEALERLHLMTREARLSREATEKAVASRTSRSELERALRAADAPEDSMATDDDLIRYEGRAEAVAIMRDMLGV